MWDNEFWRKLDHLGVPEHMLKRAVTGMKARWKPIQDLFDQRTLPELGWSDFQIRQLLATLSSLDSDKDPGAIRIGEREGRVSTPYLYELSGGFSHGVGRSGELSAAQPKAAGASLMQNLTNKLILSLIKTLGITNVKKALTVPLGTGMTLGMALRGTMNYHKCDLRTHYKVLMPRLDHKSPKKGLEYVGTQVHEISGHYGENFWAKEGVYVSMADIEAAYELHKENLVAIVSNTSFFAPRVPDNVKKIAKFAKEHNLIHIINNAYGIQSERVLNLIRSAVDAGRVDAIVQSTDKNFLVPVGGSVITSPNPEIIQTISQSYAGRASASPVVQLLVSLLSLGKKGYLEKLKIQQANREKLHEGLHLLAKEMGEEIIACENPISCAMSLHSFSSDQVAELGGYLYNLRVTGPRIVNITAKSFGSCTEEMPWSYLVMNAAVGSVPGHILEAVSRLRKAMNQIRNS